MRYWTDGEGKEQGLREGEVLVSNHPQLAGGSHLPDITVITPVFDNGRIVFCVASRGHHQDVGGTTPGSMPPNSQCLAEEGAAILAFKLVENGKFQVRLSPRAPRLPGLPRLSPRLQCIRPVPGEICTGCRRPGPSESHISCMPQYPLPDLLHNLLSSLQSICFGMVCLAFSRGLLTCR